MGNKESTNSKAGAGDRSNNKVKKGKKEVQDKLIENVMVLELLMVLVK